MPRNQITTYQYVVAGYGEFPIDMLRYDRATPRMEEDANKIAHTFNPRVNRQKREIRLMAFLKPPTIDRWLSFGWEVISDVATVTL